GIASSRNACLVTRLDNLFQKLSEGSAELIDPLALESGDDVVVVDAGRVQLVEEVIRVLQVGLERLAQQVRGLERRGSYRWALSRSSPVRSVPRRRACLEGLDPWSTSRPTGIAAWSPRSQPVFPSARR